MDQLRTSKYLGKCKDVLPAEIEKTISAAVTVKHSLHSNSWLILSFVTLNQTE